MSDNAAFRTWLFAFGATTVATLVCTAYVDRPIALFFDAHLRHTAAWGWISLALAPLDLVVIAALLFSARLRRLGCVRSPASSVDSNAASVLLVGDVGHGS